MVNETTKRDDNLFDVWSPKEGNEAVFPQMWMLGPQHAMGSAPHAAVYG